MFIPVVIVQALRSLWGPQVSAGDIVAFLRRCQDPAGGFGGGPGQLPHLAPTYAGLSPASMPAWRLRLRAKSAPALAMHE